VDHEEAEFYSCKGKLTLADPFTKTILELPLFELTRSYYMGRGHV
jgi:hypothetical protein